MRVQVRLLRLGYLVIAILCVFVPAVLATAIVGIRVADSFVIAADSKVTYKGPDSRGPATLCKIYQSGPLYFALAGMAFDRNRGFFPEKIVADNFSATDSLISSMERIERMLSDSLKVEMKRLKTEDPGTFAYNQRPGVDILSIIAGEMVDGRAQMSGRGFKYVDEISPVAITRLDCPGDCPTDVKFFFAGHSDAAINTFNQFPHDGGTVRTPVTDARKMIESEIQASPEDVGPPITILQVDKNGASWPSNDSGCPILVTPTRQ
jgi:hypothetical protein